MHRRRVLLLHAPRPPQRAPEWVPLGSGPARSLIYRSQSLDVRNPAIRRALIMVHGTNRNADDYFKTAVTAAFMAGALDDTVVISPRIASQTGSCKDTLAANEVSWSCTGDSWRSGGNSSSHPDLMSFDFIDQILRKLANKTIFPEHAGDRRRRPFRRRPGRRALSDGEQGARDAWRAGELRRRQSVELRVAGCHAGVAGR